MRSDYHVTPVDDLVPHLDSRDCWCVPVIEDVANGKTLVTHHAADEREIGEQFEDAAIQGAERLMRDSLRRRAS